MALNKAMKAALKVLSYPDIKMKKNYRFVRLVNQMAHRDYMPKTYKMWDEPIMFGNREIPLRIFAPDESVNHPLIIYFHGGGWVIGNIDSYTQVLRGLQDTPLFLLITVWRLSIRFRLLLRIAILLQRKFLQNMPEILRQSRRISC